jgi:hypothetical protein
MINVLFSLVAIAASVAGIFAGQKLAGQKAENPSAADPAHPANPEFVTPEIMVFPIINAGNLSGYLVTRFSLQIKNQNASKSPVGDDILLTDAFYSAAFEEAGTARFESALVQQFDLFDRHSLRRKNVRERQIQKEETPKPPKVEH